MGEGTCVFCARWGVLSDEHPLSGQLHRHLPGRPADATSIVYRGETSLPVREVFRFKQTTKRGFYASKAVCTSCNNGWMNELDLAVEPFVGPMIEGRTTILSVTAQHVVSSWATKFALTVEAFHPETSVVPARVYHEYYDTREPVPRQLLHVGRYVGAELHTYVRRTIDLKDQYRTLSREGVLITFTIGELLVQATLPGESPTLRTQSVEGRDRLSLVPLSIAPITWPPDLSVSDAEIGYFTAAFQLV